MSETAQSTPSTGKLLIGGGIALVVALGALAVILPAELGIDPFGTGEATGLSDLAEAGEMTELERGALREGVLTLSKEPLLTDSWTRELAPFESIEFKYTMAEGEPMVFSWQATAPVKYDMHSHPFDGGVELTESYGVDQAAKMEGAYIAPFTGIHGWYWQNQTMDNVTLVLNATGGFTESTVFEGAAEIKRPIAAAE